MTEAWQITKWGHLIMMAILFASIYGITLWITMSRETTRQILSHRQVRFMRHLYAPFSCIVLIAIFIGINPIVHGVLVGLVLFGFGSWIKNALSGALIKYHNRLKLGEYYTIDGQRARLLRMDMHRAVFTKTEGQIFVPYQRLHERIIEHDIHTGQSSQILVTAAGDDLVDEQRLRMLLFDCPIIHHDHAPSIVQQSDSSVVVTAALRAGMSAPALVQYLEERLPDYSINQDLNKD